MTTLHICRGPEMREIHRESKGDRLCFKCRKRREFLYLVHAPAEPSYYGPNPSIVCGTCNQVDGDIGFGGAREWTE